MIKSRFVNDFYFLLQSADKKLEKLGEKGQTPELVTVPLEPDETDVHWFGHYMVSGSKGNFYHLFFGINDDGDFWISCTCRAGLEGLGCYHALHALNHHVKIMRQKSNKEMDNSPYLKGGSDKKPETFGKIRI